MSFYLDGSKQQGGLRDPAPIITMHTSENQPGTRNLALAVFIRGRSDYGSYDSICDTHDSWMQLSGWRTKTWHAPATNGFSMGHSFVTQAHVWKDLSARARKSLLLQGAEACHKYSRWCVAIGIGPVPARRITREQALAKVPGFATHGEVQPQDRTDPGRDFPWEEFFNYYRAFGRLDAPAPVAAPAPTPVAPVPAPKPRDPSIPKGWCRATVDASLHLAPLAASPKVRDVKAGEALLVAADAEASAWWLQVGDYYIQRRRVEEHGTAKARKLHHGNYPDRDLPLNGTRTTELDLAWEELLYRIGAHTGKPYADIHAWLGTKNVTGPTELRRQRHLKKLGYYEGEEDGIRGPITLRAEKEYLNDQRLLFTPKPTSARRELHGYAGAV